MKRGYFKIIPAIVVLAILINSCDNKIEAISKIHQYEQSRNFDPVFFEEMSKDKNSDVRLIAARAIGRIQNKSSIDLLLNRLQEESDEGVLREIIWSISQMPIDKTTDSLVARNLEEALLHFAGSELRENLLAGISQSLGILGSHFSSEFFSRELQSQMPARQAEAAIAVGLLAKNKKIILDKTMPQLDSLLNNNSSVSWTAAYAYYQMSLPNKISRMKEVLNSPYVDTQVYALKAIHKMIQKLAEPHISSILPKERYQMLVAKAYDKSLWLEISNLVNSDSWQLRLEIARMYGKINPDEHLQELEQLAYDSSTHVAIAAFKALGQIRNAKSLKIIESGLQSKNNNIFSSALQSYTRLKKQAGLFHITRTLESPIPERRIAAIEALGIVGNNESQEILISKTGDSEVAVRLAAFSELANVKPIRHKILLQGLSSNDPAIVSTCAMALGESLNDENTRVFISAYKKFNRLETVETAQDIIRAMLKGNTQIPRDTLIQLANRDVPLTYNILRDFLIQQNDTLTEINSVNQLKTFPEEQMGNNAIAVLKTERGDIRISLFHSLAPQTVDNFVSLAKNGFYDGLKFHRVVSDFVIQGGDPDGTGWGGPGYAIPCEYSKEHYERGTVGMATAGKDTAGSQFFICHSPQPHLNGRYTIFGSIIEGYDILDKIEKNDRIFSIQIIEN